MAHAPIKNFVRNVLGCTCPDSVFEHIEDNSVHSPGSPHTRSITVGNRLLIYIWPVNTAEELQEGFPVLLAAGKAERDTRGLNRFRAVLAVEAFPEASVLANQCLFRFKDSDDRIHIHVIPADDLKNL